MDRIDVQIQEVHSAVIRSLRAASDALYSRRELAYVAPCRWGRIKILREAREALREARRAFANGDDGIGIELIAFARRSREVARRAWPAEVARTCVDGRCDHRPREAR